MYFFGEGCEICVHLCHDFTETLSRFSPSKVRITKSRRRFLQKATLMNTGIFSTLLKLSRHWLLLYFVHHLEPYYQARWAYTWRLKAFLFTDRFNCCSSTFVDRSPSTPRPSKNTVLCAAEFIDVSVYTLSAERCRKKTYTMEQRCSGARAG